MIQLTYICIDKETYENFAADDTADVGPIYVKTDKRIITLLMIQLTYIYVDRQMYENFAADDTANVYLVRQTKV